MTQIHSDFLQHQAFLHRLALTLVGDEHAAGDVVQDAALALARLPAHRRPEQPRAWLATVVRRMAGKSVRGRLRREDRERMVAVDERIGDGLDEVDARLDAHAVLLNAVQHLPDEQRAVVTLRYAEGLSPREISRRLEASVDTVHTRHRRALIRLRKALDATTGGDRRAWALALVPQLETQLETLPGSQLSQRLGSQSVVKAATVDSGSRWAMLFSLAWGKWIAGVAFLGALAWVGVEALTAEEASDVFSAEAELAGLPEPLATSAERDDETAGRSLVSFDEDRGRQALQPLMDEGSSPTPSSASATFVGRVVIHDPAGVRMSGPANGVLRATLRRGGQVDRIEIPVASGEARLELESDGEGRWLYPERDGRGDSTWSEEDLAELKVQVSAGELKGLGPVVLMEGPGSTAVQRERDFSLGQAGETIHLRTLAPLALRVVDAASVDVDLSGVEVVLERDGFFSMAEGPSRRPERLMSNVTSPLSLEYGVEHALANEIALFVRAEGYAWRKVHVTPSRATQRTIDLWPGSSLDVTVRGEVPREAKLWLFRSGEWRPVRGASVSAQGVLRLDGLPLGDYDLRLMVGSPFLSTPVLGEAKGTVQLGARGSAVLVAETPQASQPPRPAPSQGVPLEWDTNITVSAVDSQTGRIVDSADKIRWFLPGLDDAEVGQQRRARRRKSTGLFGLKVPRATVQISFGSHEHMGHATVDAMEDLHVDLRLMRRSLGTIQLRDGNEVIPWPRDVGLQLSHLDGRRCPMNLRGTSEQREFSVRGRGRYQLKLPHIAGFEPLERIEFDMQPEAPAELVIPLRRVGQ